jgi:nitronate monooxygenase
VRLLSSVGSTRSHACVARWAWSDLSRVCPDLYGISDVNRRSRTLPCQRPIAVRPAPWECNRACSVPGMRPSGSGSSFLDEIGMECPVVQAGMAGGVAGGELAGAVSAAGGLGTVGMMAPRAFAAALREALHRARGRAVAANLLVPFIRQAHVDACAEAQAALVVLHGGCSRRWIARLRARGLRVLVTVGTPAQARQALAAHANGLVVQGLQAGGHLLGVEPIEHALPRVLDVAGDAPVLAAGGVAEAHDVRRLLDIGATAAIAGTRFLLTEESAAHPEYKRRVLGAERTIVTLLFGLGWPLRHRVIPNAATERWCSKHELGPLGPRVAGRLSAPLGRFTPLEAMGKLMASQRLGLPLFTPALPLAGMPADTLERSALYAGQSARRLHDLIPAAQALSRLAPA